MADFDLINMKDKELQELYKKELEKVGETSLESVINEFNRRETSKLSKRMYFLTYVILGFTIVSTVISILTFLQS